MTAYPFRSVLLAVFGLAVTALALSVSFAVAAPVSPRPAKDVETRITADKLTYTANKQQAVFESRVHVQRPDFQLWADRLTVHFKPSGKAQENAADKPEKSGGLPEGMGAGELDRLVASGNVRMSAEGGRNGTCSKATYTAADGVLVMEGNPKVSDAENTITGEVIKYYTQENRSEVIGGKNRVEAVFSSPAKSGKTDKPEGGR